MVFVGIQRESQYRRYSVAARPANHRLGLLMRRAARASTLPSRCSPSICFSVATIRLSINLLLRIFSLVEVSLPGDFWICLEQLSGKVTTSLDRWVATCFKHDVGVRTGANLVLRQGIGDQKIATLIYKCKPMRCYIELAQPRYASRLSQHSLSRRYVNQLP